jgi:hypothetical protein
MSPLINQLRSNPRAAKEIIPLIFKEIDPDKKHQLKLLWLMAMPDSMLDASFQIFGIAKLGMMETPTTLGELAKLDSSGTIFECLESGASYQLMGYHADGVAVRAFTTDMIEIMSPQTIIHRVF